MKLRLVLSLVLAIAPLALAADGDILERTTIDDGAESGVSLERVIYESDGLRIEGFLAYPASAAQAEAPLPCVMFNRGGNRDFGAFSAEGAARLGGMIAGWGYVMFASNYRGAPGSEGADEFGGADVNDVINGLRVFEQLEFADAERIGMWGHSRGGMMTYLALARTDRIDAAIIGAGLADAVRMMDLRPEMEEGVLAECVPDFAANRDEALNARSAVQWPERMPDNTPILLVQGTADWRVDPRDSLDMAAGLQANRKPYRLLMVEGADHSLTEDRDAYMDAARAWLDRYVRDQAALPNLEPHGN